MWTYIHTHTHTYIHTTRVGIKPKFEEAFAYRIIEALDMPSFNLAPFFTQCIEFIEHSLEEGTGILVHCFAGISRSSTICIAYLMKKNKWRFEQALKYVHSKRAKINPNIGFRYTCAHILRHSYTHTLIYSYTHTYTHMLIHSYTHTLIHSYTHTLIYSYTHILIYSCTHTLIYSFTRILHTHMPIYSYS